MKRSLLDPLPRQLSTPALVALVALVVCGTGVAVARYLDSDPHDLRSSGAVHAAPQESDLSPSSPTDLRYGDRPTSRAGLTVNSPASNAFASPARGYRASPMVDTSSDCQVRPSKPACSSVGYDDAPSLYQPTTPGS